LPKESNRAHSPLTTTKSDSSVLAKYYSEQAQPLNCASNSQITYLTLQRRKNRYIFASQNKKLHNGCILSFDNIKYCQLKF